VQEILKEARDACGYLVENGRVPMGKIITVTGKDGAGKTTVSAPALRLLIEHNKGVILAVDADPNQNFDAAIGVQVVETVGVL